MDDHLVEANWTFATVNRDKGAQPLDPPRRCCILIRLLMRIRRSIGPRLAASA
ncbi:hypothetical protein ACFRAO_01975 [Streptomyces sp. NPDC056656]|uniref:hypothetical protein n=1 Tax=Streptomyces sp. NPDC056656 TaxID=3345895 RepID=UPI00368C8EDB